MSSLRDTVPRVLGFLDVPCAVRLLETCWGIYDRLDAREWNLHFARCARLLDNQRWARYASLQPKLGFARGHFTKKTSSGTPYCYGRLTPLVKGVVAAQPSGAHRRRSPLLRACII